MKNTNKILMALIALIIIAGIVMICVKGFNYSLLYSKADRMNIYIEKDFDIKEIKDIAKEVLGTGKLEVQSSNAFGTVASIVAKEITEEQENSIIEKINEKYEIQINKDNDVILTEVSQANAWNLVEKYILPLIIATAIILVYYAIRFRKQGVNKFLVIPVLSLIIINALYVSIVALTRIPVNEFFAVFVVLIYILTIVCNTIKLNKEEL